MLINKSRWLFVLLATIVITQTAAAFPTTDELVKEYKNNIQACLEISYRVQSEYGGDVASIQAIGSDGEVVYDDRGQRVGHAVNVITRGNNSFFVNYSWGRIHPTKQDFINWYIDEFYQKNNTQITKIEVWNINQNEEI